MKRVSIDRSYELKNYKYGVQIAIWNGVRYVVRIAVRNAVRNAVSNAVYDAVYNAVRVGVYEFKNKVEHK